MNTKTHKPALLKQNDIVSFYHIQMPHWLFADKRYNKISLAAKVAYSLLLNRYQLSKLHGWVNEAGEVFIIFPREELADTLQVSAHKAISVFKELVDARLVWEVRRGNNKANHIYLTRVRLSNEDAADYNNAPFLPRLAEDNEHTADDLSGHDPGHAEIALPVTAAYYEDANNTAEVPVAEAYGHAENALPGTPEHHVRSCNNHTSGGSKNAVPDMRNQHPSYTDSSYIDNSHIELSQSVSHGRARESPDRLTDSEIEELDDILDSCELWAFSSETAKVFENSIERLFFSESFKIGNCILPQQKVRSHLHELDQVKLMTAENKIARNTSMHIRNTTAYTMAVIFNSIWETESDIMSDPYLNSLRTDPPLVEPGGGG
jgi:hypothetical protein